MKTPNLRTYAIMFPSGHRTYIEATNPREAIGIVCYGSGRAGLAAGVYNVTEIGVGWLDMCLPTKFQYTPARIDAL